MEQSLIDISALKFGNFMLDRWLSSEEAFWKFILNSFPCQICMITVYTALIRSGDVDKSMIENLNHPNVVEACGQVSKWFPDSEPLKFKRLLKAVISISTLAEKRLEVTTGV
jgi:hypothetical protein